VKSPYGLGYNKKRVGSARKSGSNKKDFGTNFYIGPTSGITYSNVDYSQKYQQSTANTYISYPAAKLPTTISPLKNNKKLTNSKQTLEATKSAILQ